MSPTDTAARKRRQILPRLPAVNMRVPPVQTLTVPVPGLTEPVQLLQHGNIDELAADFLTRLPTRAASDPGFYGALLWPGALLLAQLLAAGPCLRGSTVLELGAGTGLGTLVAAHRGARAIASDVYPLSLQLCARPPTPLTLALVGS